MQHPVGYKIVERARPQLTSVWALLTSKFALWALGHTILAGLIVGVDRRARRRVLAPPARPERRAVPARREARADRRSCRSPRFNLWFGSNFGDRPSPSAQPMKIAATEALWDTEQPVRFSLFQIGGFTQDDQTPPLLDRRPATALVPGDRLVQRQGARAERAAGQYEQRSTGRGELHPAGPARLLEHAGHGLRSGRSSSSSPALGALLLLESRSSSARAGSCGRRSRRSRSRSSPRSPAGSSPRSGRQPWIVQGC